MWRMSRLSRDGPAEPVSRDQILRRERVQGNIHFPCSADHEQDNKQPVSHPPGLPLSGWAEIRQWAYNTQIPLYKHGDTSPSLVLTRSLGLIDRSYRDCEIGVSPVGPTLAAGWG